jgi:hypothetical protein
LPINRSRHRNNDRGGPEVQHGDDFGEDDIERLEDDLGRVG